MKWSKLRTLRKIGEKFTPFVLYLFVSSCRTPYLIKLFKDRLSVYKILTDFKWVNFNFMIIMMSDFIGVFRDCYS